MSKPETVEELMQSLKHGITVVKFLKKDESERIMIATLDPKLLPERDGASRKSMQLKTQTRFESTT